MCHNYKQIRYYSGTPRVAFAGRRANKRLDTFGVHHYGWPGASCSTPFFWRAPSANNKQQGGLGPQGSRTPTNSKQRGIRCANAKHLPTQSRATAEEGPARTREEENQEGGTRETKGGTNQHQQDDANQKLLTDTKMLVIFLCYKNGEHTRRPTPTIHN